MQRESEGILLEVRPHGESSCICKVFTANFGLVAGLIKGGRKKRAELTEGNIVHMSHARRLETQLGTMRVEVLHNNAIAVFDVPERLHMLRYQCEIMAALLPEDVPQPKFYDRTKVMLTSLSGVQSPWQALAHWEVDMLSAVGFGLSLSAEEAVPCEAGSPLYYVSPKSGRAVSKAMGQPYHDKMLILPRFFGGQVGEILDVFALTGHFLRHALEELAPFKKDLTSRDTVLELLLASEKLNKRV